MPPGDHPRDVAQLIDAGRDREAAEEGMRSASAQGTDQLDDSTPCDGGLDGQT
ncbi:MAG: hypothetical protein ABWZ52_10150 [Acidimicrobiales bacterium]